MDFGNLHAKDIHCVILYKTSKTHWVTCNRKDHIIGVKLAGSALHTFSNQEFVLSGNCIYFLNQKDDYRVNVFEQGEAFSIHFTTYEAIDTDSFCIELSHSDEFISILKKAEIAHNHNDNLTARSLLYAFCAKVDRLRQKNYFPKDSRMNEAKAYMDAHFKEQDCLSKAIERSNLSSRRFGELFRTHFKTTPNQYIVFSKVEYAKKLLSTQPFSIAEIASLCGFSDIYYFSKVFKSLVGITPTKYRKNMS